MTIKSFHKIRLGKEKQADCRYEGRSRTCVLQVPNDGEMRRLSFSKLMFLSFSVSAYFLWSYNFLLAFKLLKCIIGYVMAKNKINLP